MVQRKDEIKNAVLKRPTNTNTNTLIKKLKYHIRRHDCNEKWFSFEAVAVQSQTY